jgi:hypothetical protein
MKTVCQGIFVFAASAGLVACGGSSSSGETGLLSLGVSDDPIHDVDKVCIAFDAIELKPAGDGPVKPFPLPGSNVNLLDFQGMNAFPLLFEEKVDAGEYVWMRLVVNADEGSNGGLGDSSESPDCAGDDSYILSKDGTTHNLFIPSGDQSGLKFSGFTVPANGSVSFTAEWDLMRSITEPPGLDPDVILKPRVKLVDNTKVGAVRGSVSADLANADPCEPAVYLFADSNVDEVDLWVGESEASAIPSPVDETNPGLGLEYEIGFLLEGSYEAAFSCDGGTTFTTPAEGNPFDIKVGEVAVIDFK